MVIITHLTPRNARSAFRRHNAARAYGGRSTVRQQLRLPSAVFGGLARGLGAFEVSWRDGAAR